MRATHHKNYAAPRNHRSGAVPRRALSAHALMAINESSESGKEAEVLTIGSSTGHEIDDIFQRGLYYFIGQFPPDQIQLLPLTDFSPAPSPDRSNSLPWPESTPSRTPARTRAPRDRLRRLC